MQQKTGRNIENVFMQVCYFEFFCSGYPHSQDKGAAISKIFVSFFALFLYPIFIPHINQIMPTPKFYGHIFPQNKATFSSRTINHIIFGIGGFIFEQSKRGKICHIHKRSSVVYVAFQKSTISIKSLVLYIVNYILPTEKIYNTYHTDDN